MYIKNNKGITLIEIIIIIAIISIISSIVLFNLSLFRNEQALKNTTIDIVSILNTARENTLSSLNSTNYSVHFETDRVVLFTGSIYSASLSTNEVTIFSPSVIIPLTLGINISGGGNNITFERLTGEVINGTIDSSIVIQLASDATQQKTITINKTGVISSN